MENSMQNKWIEHDGRMPKIKRAAQIEVQFSGKPGLLTCAGEDAISRYFLGFYWEWQKVRVGWFRTETIRVCINPLYMPIIRYRILGGGQKEAQIELLRKISAHPDRKITGPEVPPVIKKPKVDADA